MKTKRETTTVAQAEVLFGDNLFPIFQFESPGAVKVDYGSESFRSYYQLSPASYKAGDYERWVEFWGGVKLQEESEVFSRLDELIEKAPRCFGNGYEDLFNKLRRVVEDYLVEMEENESLVKRPSSGSLLNLFLYLPQLPLEADIYIEHDSGFFGVSLRKGKDRLALTVKDNREVIYSFVSLDLGIAKISGRSYISDFRESKKLKKVIRILSDG